MNSLATTSNSRSSWVKFGLFGFVILYLLATLGLGHMNNYDQGLLLVAVTYSILALSLDMVAGTLGLFSLGHAGFFAIGAYLSAILINNYHWNIFLTLAFVMAVNVVVGYIIGALSLRVSGLYFAIVTYIFTLIVVVVAEQTNITGGYQGIAGGLFPNFPKSLSFLGTSVVWAVSAALLITLTIVWSIRKSPAYPVLLAIRDAEPFAQSSGVKTSRTKVSIFALSAALAALAGWTFCFLGYVAPSDFGGTASINILVMVILGGMNTILGPIVGAVFISLFPVVVNWNPLIQEILFGAIFIFVVIVVPEGFVGLVARVASRLLPKSWRRGTSETVFAVPVASSPAAKVPAQAVNESSEYAIEASGIDFSYVSGVSVLKDVSIRARRGTIHGLIGPNGSGKSTLVNLLSGQLKTKVGTISLHGHRVERLDAAARPHYGLMRTFQTAVMVKAVTTRENVTIGLFHKYRRIPSRSLIWPLLRSGRRDGRELVERSRAALLDAGLDDTWSRTKVADIPHGVEQLTQLAAACAGAPTILILDEPLAGLSGGEVDHVSEILRTLRNQGTTILVVEHQTRFIFDVCDDVTVIAAGELVKSGTASEVRVDQRVREVYLGQ
jgi:branched-chain amino acid transport system permease protein